MKYENKYFRNHAKNIKTLPFFQLLESPQLPVGHKETIQGNKLITTVFPGSIHSSILTIHED